MLDTRKLYIYNITINKYAKIDIYIITYYEKLYNCDYCKKGDISKLNNNYCGYKNIAKFIFLY